MPRPCRLAGSDWGVVAPRVGAAQVQAQFPQRPPATPIHNRTRATRARTDTTETIGDSYPRGRACQSALPVVPLRAVTDSLWVDHRGCLSNLRQLTAKAGAGLQSRRRRARTRRVGSMADGPWRSDTTFVSPTTTFVLVSSLDPTSKKFLQVSKNPISSGTDRALGESNKFLFITVGDGWRIAPLCRLRLGPSVWQRRQHRSNAATNEDQRKQAELYCCQMTKRYVERRF